VDYVRAQVEAAGLKAEVEPVTDVPPWERGSSDQCELLLPDGSRDSLRIVALTNSAGGDVEGEVVLVNDFDQDRKPPAHRFDEGGKKRIIYFSRPLERDHTVNGYFKAVSQRNHGASWAAKYGAKAVLVRSVQTGNGPPHTGVVVYDPKSRKIPAAALSVEAADRLEAELLKHERISVHLKTNPRKTARLQANVVIRVPGTTLPGEIVLLGAHLDSHDITPGAADDAAGVAAVLAIMREFAKNPSARTMLFVLFADEEISGSGNRAFIEKHKKEVAHIIAATEVDDGDGAPYALQATSAASDKEAALLRLRQLAEAIGDEAARLDVLTQPETNGADVSRLWECHGIPEIAMLQDMTTYFDKHHAENDTPNNVNWEGLGRTTSLLSKIMRVLTSGAAVPLRGVPAHPCTEE
jgi:hypothetical protein